MLTCKFIFSAKWNRTFFFPFLLKIKSFSGIRQLVDRWADVFPEKIRISNQHSIAIHCVSWGDWQKTAGPTDVATADQVLGSCPRPPWLRTEVHWVSDHAPFVLPMQGSALDRCAQQTVVPLFSFQKRIVFYQTKEERKSPSSLCNLLVYVVPQTQTLVMPKARMVTGTFSFCF